jgi:hypothetical protein
MGNEAYTFEMYLEMLLLDEGMCTASTGRKQANYMCFE